MRLLTIFLLITLTTSCQKKKPGEDQFITLRYSQTACADAWPTGSSDSATRANLSAYLKGQNLYAADITIKKDGAEEACLACTCKTGKTIYVSTLNDGSLKTRYVQLGFRE